MEELQLIKFDYTKLDNTTTEFLKVREFNMHQITNNAMSEIGKELKQVQEHLAKHGYGCFEEWYTSLKFKRQTVYNCINCHELILQNPENQNLIEELPKSLIYDITSPSADQELKEQVFSGDIKTHKEYQEALRAKHEAEEKAKFLEKQLKIEEEFGFEKEKEIREKDKQLRELRDSKPVEKEVSPFDYETLKSDNQRLKSEAKTAKDETLAYKIKVCIPLHL